MRAALARLLIVVPAICFLLGLGGLLAPARVMRRPDLDSVKRALVCVGFSAALFIVNYRAFRRDL